MPLIPTSLLPSSLRLPESSKPTSPQPPKPPLPPPPSRSASSTPLPPSTTRPILPGPARSHQSGAIEQHWNDLPPNFLPDSRSVSPNPASKTLPTPSSGDDGFLALLKQLFLETPSTMEERERNMIYQRILKFSDSMTEGQKGELAGVMGRVLRRDEAPAWGRERVVEFMKRERGVAGFAAGLRRGVECINLDE